MYLSWIVICLCLSVAFCFENLMGGRKCFLICYFRFVNADPF